MNNHKEHEQNNGIIDIYIPGIKGTKEARNIVDGENRY
jgi:hypothetical protein